MSEIRPFPAIRYNTATSNELSARLAPPYDVLSDADKQELLSRDAHNFVKIDLPHTPPKAAGPAAVYEQARKEMDQWLAEGVLTQDATPAIYVYHQHYTYEGRTYVRKMFFARLRLEQFGTGNVFPHEQTFGGPKEDRLCLTKACEANMSPIFGLYPDAKNEVAAKLDAATSAKPIAQGVLDGVESKLWALTDGDVLGPVIKMMADKPVFIADGHHRYGTGLLYREYLEQTRGPLANDDPANFVLCVFCAMEDPGLLILPTHRVIGGVSVGPEVFDTDHQVEVKEFSATEPAAAISALGQLGPQALLVYSGKTKRYTAIRPMEAAILDDIVPDRSVAYRRLGLSFLHNYVLDKVVTPKLCGGAAPEIKYIKAVNDAIETADATGGTAFLMQPNTMEELSGVCQAGDLMPQKSTFFYPKLASGLVVNPLKA